MKVFEEIVQIQHRGIDLTQFAKQLIMYLDAHLFEDIDFSLALSEALSEIMSKIRYYPYPVVMYKIVLHAFMKGEDMKKSPAKITTASTKQLVTKDTKEKTEEYTRDEKVEQIEKQQGSESTERSTDTNLWEEFLAKAAEDSFGIMLKKYCTLDDSNPNTLIITTINKMAEISLKKDENLQKMAGYFSALGHHQPIEIVFKKKEDFLKEGLL